MSKDHDNHESGCGCDAGCGRRDFLTAMGMAAGGLAFTAIGARGSEDEAKPRRAKEPAVVRAVFLYPPSTTFSENPDGWWSWPGNEFDAEGRQKQYMSPWPKWKSGWA